jgi:biotin carboxyl carrier protein
MTDKATVNVDVVALEDRADGYRVTIGEQVFELSARLFQRAALIKQADAIVLQYEGREYRLFDAAQQRRAAPRGGGDLRAPMAGKVIQVLVADGAQVTAGDTLLILEAMKMEQQIVAPHDGVVDHVLCQAGEQVTAGMELVVLRATGATETPS